MTSFVAARLLEDSQLLADKIVMPELPEVQTTVDYLRKKLVGLKFKDVWTDWPKTFKKAGGFEAFKKAIKNKEILSIRRRAKFIVIDIEGPDFSSSTKSRNRKIEDPRFANSDKSRKANRDKYSIFIHQKISGHLLYGRWVRNQKSKIKNQNDKSKIKNNQIWISTTRGPLRDDPDNRFIRTIFFLSNGWQLAFSDLRRFGKIVLVKDDDLSELPEIKELGPEPLEINSNQFRDLFRSSTPKHRKKVGRIKQVLMDPFFIAGIGNIYADEILWDSGFHPLSRAEHLSDADLKKIFSSIVKILKKAIKLGGSSVEDYRMPSGEKGDYQNQTKAYQREGEKCSRNDGGIIQRIKIGGRSAHFCPVHQKKL